MAENKYITQTQENGQVLIAEEVLVNIISVAVAEVEGAELSGKPGINWGKGIKIQILDNETVAVDCNVTVTYGMSVVSVAKAAQDSVVSAVESMTGVKVAGVNVNICGIAQK